DRLAVRVVPVQLRLQIAAEAVQPRADVARQLLVAQNLRHGARRLAPPHLELEQPIARGRIPLYEEQVVLVLRVDVVDAPAIAQEIDRLAQAIDDERAGRGAGGRGADRGRRRGKRGR